MSSAGVQPTMPAKQRSVVMGPSTFTALERADAIWDSERTSTASAIMRRSGNLACRAWMEGSAWSGFRSQRARPEQPCSRSAVAASRASVPAPPVTVGAVRLVGGIGGIEAWGGQMVGWDGMG